MTFIDAVGPMVEGFEFEEVGGFLESVKLTYAVASSLTGIAAIESMRYDTKIPQVGASLSAITGKDTHRALVCEDRSFSNPARDSTGQTIAFVESSYRRYFRYPRVLKGGAGLNQIQTQLLDDGTVATVEYDGRQQAGELTVSDPTGGISIQVTEITDDPFDKSLEWSGVINSSLFRGGAPGTWMVTDVDFEPGLASGDNSDDVGLYNGRSLWHFTYRLEYNYNGWDPSAAYKDPETGEFPADLVVGTGIKTFEYYFRKDLNNLFKPRWTGPTPTSPPAPVIPPVP